VKEWLFCKDCAEIEEKEKAMGLTLRVFPVYNGTHEHANGLPRWG